MSSERQPYLCDRLQGFGTTIFTEMTRLAIEHKAVNLGQGFPNFDGPAFVKDAAIAAMRREDGTNQYRRMAGLMELTTAIAEHQQRFWGLSYEPASEISVFAGATEAIFASLQALCNPGDEVVMFEPYYDSYRASVAMAGAKAKFVTLRAPSFTYDPKELEQAISPRTRVILLNTPHNPTGKVFSRTELEHIAELCRRHNLIAITDEVYEHLVYDGEHICLASLPGMRERCVVISSLGKSFSLTGWKIGHTCASPEISAAIRCAHQFITFCVPGPLQLAAAAAYRADDSYFAGLTQTFKSRRDRLCDGLAKLGLEVLVPAGTYFVLTDIRPLGFT
ncbi:MAG: aminotransferase class I/II-fold pyridoxal phosphate-dependent enzyme, partial [Nannocystaceae bacterium]